MYRDNINKIFNNLDKNFTWKNFIQEKYSNKFAVACAEAIIKNPGNTYNPFFLFGPLDSGKTHLAQAIGNELLNKFPHFKIIYLTGLEFANICISTDSNDLNNLISQTDLLILDDICAIEHDKIAENILWDIFNKMYYNNKQLILIADIKPYKLNFSREGFKSKLYWGIVSDIEYLEEYDSKIKLIKKETEKQKIIINEESLDTLANQKTKNIFSIIHLAKFYNVSITNEFIANTLRNFEKQTQDELTHKIIG